MKYGLTSQQKLIREIVENVAQNELKPMAEITDREHRFPKENIELLAKLGLMGISLPKQYGGSGGDYLSYILALEEIAKACATTCVIMAVHVSVGCYPILNYGTEEQKQQFLTPLASGKHLGGFALTEPEAGTDASAQKTTAVLDGNEWVLNGTKTFITNAKYANTYIILAMTGKTKNVNGISAFIVPADTKGFSVGKIEDKMGICGSSTGELVLQDVRIPKSYLLGKEGEGFKIAMNTLNGGRIGIAAQALGIAQSALAESVQYAKEREQFNRPLAAFQGLQWYIADMATKIEAGKLMLYNTARMKEKNVPYAKESAMVKLFASETATYVTHKALQILGGYGYTKDYVLERLYRDARITEIYEGTSEVQKMVISTHVIK